MREKNDDKQRILIVILSVVEMEKMTRKCFRKDENNGVKWLHNSMLK